MLIRLAVRIAVWQVAVAAFALAARDGTTWAMVAACTLLGITAIRVRGRWLDRWFLIFLWYRGRARVRRAATALGVIAPQLDTHEYTAPGGAVAGVLTDGPHWVAVLRLDGQVQPAPLVAALRSSVDPDGLVRASSVQLVRWAVPRPVDPDKQNTVRAWNVDWIAVRGSSTSSPAAALRLATVLGAQGFSVRVLREAELTAELASSLGVAPAAGGAAVTARENWWSLSLGRLHHATYHLVRPPRDPARLAHAVAWLAGPPSLSTCVSVLFCPGDPEPEVEVAVRIAVPAGRSRREVKGALRKALGPMASHTRAMNGRHTEGILATLPLASVNTAR